MTCGNCTQCVPLTLAELASGGKRGRDTIRQSVVSEAQLLRHAKRHGWDQVAETAAQLGVNLAAPKAETDREKATRLKKDKAWALHDRGRTPEEIASRLSCAVSTVRRYLSDPA